jgi:hypothetical protein
LQELGLDRHLNISFQTAYAAMFSEAATVNRLDAEYFQPKYYRTLEAIQALKPEKIVPLGNLLLGITNGQTPLRHDFSTGEVPFLTAEHVFDFRINFDSPKRILLKHHQTVLERTSLQEGDVLVTIKGRVGNAAVVEHLPGPTNINQDVALLRLKPNCHPYYIAGFLNSKAGKAFIEQISTGQINPFLGLGSLKQIPIPIFEKSRMDELGELIKQRVNEAYLTQQQAKSMLERAKQSVEQMILGDELSEN